MAKIEAGTMLSFAGGEYSDKWNYGPFEVLRDFDQQEVVDAYKSSLVGQKTAWGEDVDPDEGGFTAWLVTSGYIGDVDKSYCWYMGGYGFEPVIP